MLASCSLTPKPLGEAEQKEILSRDLLEARRGVEPVGARLTLSEAIARGLKYNLEYRSKMMEQAVALGASDLSNYDLLPKVVANAGYNYRNNYFSSYAVGAYTGIPVTSEPLITSARTFGVAGLALSWNLLDFGVSYYNAVQNADKILVASERRRHSMHQLMQDIQIAYVQAAASQHLSQVLAKTIKAAELALKDSAQGQEEGLQTPLDGLRYRKTILDNVKILETIRQELSSSIVELNQLINLPVESRYELVSPESLSVPNSFSKIAISEFEERALANNADLKESIYNTRIAVAETHQSMLKLLPGINLTAGPQTSNNSFYLNQNWLEGAAQLTFNFWNLLLAPKVLRQGEANEALAIQKRMMVQMAVLGQVHLAQQSLGQARFIYQRAVEIAEVDDRIAAILKVKEKDGSASRAETVAAEATAIVSRLKRYQALSQMYVASGRLQASTGLEPDISSINDIELKDLSQIVKTVSEAWHAGELPPLVLVSSAIVPPPVKP